MDSIYPQKKNTNVNVLLVTIAAQGHFNPILRLGHCLVSKGLIVTLATNHYALKYLGSTSTTAKTIGGVHLEFYSDGLPIDYNRKADTHHFLKSLAKFGPGNLLALIRSHSCKFACIINTPFIPWVADVAARLNVPNAMLWIQPFSVYQIYSRYYNKLNDFPSESNPDLRVKLPGLPTFDAEELPSFILPSNTSYMLSSTLNKVFGNMHKVKWVLGNSFMELEKDVIMSINNSGHVFLPVGPIVPKTFFGEEEDVGLDLCVSNGESNYCLNWLDKQKLCSVIYISFGTLLFLPKNEIESIALGLKNTKRPFIWVIMQQDGQEVPEPGLFEEIKEQGLIVKWCPQTMILSHPSVGCFLSHCGWNSLLESIAAGVPVIACPQWTDQPTNAKLVSDVWGIGVRVMKNSDGVLIGDEVERCIEEVMSGPRSKEFRKNAAEMKTAAREAVGDGGSSDKNIEMFVNEIISSCK